MTRIGKSLVGAGCLMLIACGLLAYGLLLYLATGGHPDSESGATVNRIMASGFAIVLLSFALFVWGLLTTPRKADRS